mmetsp:Transcript_60510/g.129848  ORF Transcript_60510/g.129848 Transcript_60510/m.129848 type:complete len:237 (-) Transcript_60510:186-896(-)
MWTSTESPRHANRSSNSSVTPAMQADPVPVPLSAEPAKHCVVAAASARLGPLLHLPEDCSPAPLCGSTKIMGSLMVHGCAPSPRPWATASKAAAAASASRPVSCAAFAATCGKRKQFNMTFVIWPPAAICASVVPQKRLTSLASCWAFLRSSMTILGGGVEHTAQGKGKALRSWATTALSSRRSTVERPPASAKTPPRVRPATSRPRQVAQARPFDSTARASEWTASTRERSWMPM